ncbi:hypothetical protein I5677_07840 [Mobilitalea sibirica]|uniref:Copper amine oxidase-like N-terminal domain-containing protein n=1 Tax=Mobilitalea sibirica TaxID=1462919 RepID=A0A8J7HB81_9FIRM|nr:stalk domain-containing protein [Mobilitalea sibirica]MBH1940796.1 hypothetical protein [Mobilitalea sibirica]
MKKIICLIITASLLFSSSVTVFAKPDKEGKQDRKHITHQYNQRNKEKKQIFKWRTSPVIRYGRFKLPIKPITEGMGAEVTFDKDKDILTITKDDLTIVIDFNKEIVTVNGEEISNSDVFQPWNRKKTIVLIKYILMLLGYTAEIDDEEIIIKDPNLEPPTNITVTPIGEKVKPHTLNSNTQYIIVSAKITAGQAAGGRAELYVGDKVIATDETITEYDTIVTFTTSDGTPTNAELKTAIPTGGYVTVRLYNADHQYVTSKKGNPKLTVDYQAPTLTSILSAVYNPSDRKLYIVVEGAGKNGDKVDVTKLNLLDTQLSKSYQLTNKDDVGSQGTVVSDKLLTVTIGSADKIGLNGFGSSTLYLTIAAGSLLYDEAGNTSPYYIENLTIPVAVIHSK